MAGHIRKRGKESWELKFDAGRDPSTGERKIEYHSFRGTKREANLKLAELVTSVGKGTYVEPTKMTVKEFCAVPRRSVGSGRQDHGQIRAALSAAFEKSNRPAPRHQTSAEAYAPRC